MTYSHIPYQPCHLANFLFTYAHLADGVEALTLAKLVIHLARTLLALLEAPHCKRVLSISEVNAAQVEVGTVEILQQIVLPKTGQI